MISIDVVISTTSDDTMTQRICIVVFHHDGPLKLFDDYHFSLPTAELFETQVEDTVLEDISKVLFLNKTMQCPLTTENFIKFGNPQSLV